MTGAPIVIGSFRKAVLRIAVNTAVALIGVALVIPLIPLALPLMALMLIGDIAAGICAGVERWAARVDRFVRR